MGIIEEELGKTTLSNGSQVYVEYNEGDIIHIHIGDFRIDFSQEEFREFSQAIKQGKRDIETVKDGI